MEGLKKAYALLHKVIEYLVIMMTGVLVVVVFYNVISRYFLDQSVLWADEVSRFLFIFVSLFGCIIAQQKDEHMHLDVFIKIMPKKLGASITVLADLIVLSTVYILVVGGMQYSMFNMDWKTSVLQIPFGLVYGMVPVAMSVFAIQYLIKITADIKTLLNTFKNVKEVEKC